jgi:hypothetical protein
MTTWGTLKKRPKFFCRIHGLQGKRCCIRAIYLGRDDVGVNIEKTRSSGDENG